MFGLQFHPEVTHSIHGKTLLRNFAVGVCQSPTDWNMSNVAEEFIKEVDYFICFLFVFVLFLLFMINVLFMI